MLIGPDCQSPLHRKATSFYGVEPCRLGLRGAKGGGGGDEEEKCYDLRPKKGACFEVASFANLLPPKFYSNANRQHASQDYFLPEQA